MVTIKNQKSRLHDEKGNLISLKNLVKHVLPASITGASRIIFGFRPKLPWIAYSAIKAIKKQINKDSLVLEFGSGMSTLWFQERVKHIFSVEDNKEWFEKINSIILRKKIINITYKNLTLKDYFTFMADSGLKFDFVLVDGSYRDECVKHSLPLLKDSGILYLDNSDKYPHRLIEEKIPLVGNIRLAEKLVLDFAKDKSASVNYYTDFAPAQFFVQQGLMLRLPSVSKN